MKQAEVFDNFNVYDEKRTGELLEFFKERAKALLTHGVFENVVLVGKPNSDGAVQDWQSGELHCTCDVDNSYAKALELWGKKIVYVANIISNIDPITSDIDGHHLKFKDSIVIIIRSPVIDKSIGIPYCQVSKDKFAFANEDDNVILMPCESSTH